MIELIPAIDIIDGKCVRLTKGDYAQKKVYNEDPVSVAMEFERLGFKRLHVVDLDGAKSKHIVNFDVLKYLSVISNTTVTFFLSWSITVFAYSYMNVGFMKSTCPRSSVCSLLVLCFPSEIPPDASPVAMLQQLYV